MLQTMIARVRGILVTPKQELPKTIAEAGDFKSMLPYVLVMLSVGALARFVSAGLIGTYVSPQVVFGMKIGGGFFRSPIASLFSAIVSIGIGIGVWWFFAFILNALGPSFGARKDEAGAYKVAAYTATPIWLAGALALFTSVPFLGIVNSLGHLAALVYAVLIGMWALPLLMGTPEGKAPGHILAAMGITLVATIVVLFVVFSLLFGIIFASGAALLH
jgi:Yip1-like protein